MKFSYPQKNSLNLDITPLIDVVFQLIIFLLLSLGKVHSFLNLELPKLDQTIVELNEKTSILTLQYENQQSKIYWNTEKVSLKEIRERILKENPKKIILKADKKIPYGEVLPIFAEIQNFSSIELLLEYEVQK
ncbi:MAG: ExbD/TolR family protein [Leptonema sp. (in: bacteria)]